MKKLPYVKQHDEKDCGAAAVSMICRFWGIKIPLADIRARVKTDINGTTMYGLFTALEQLGFRTDGSVGTREELISAVSLKEVKLPIIARVIKENIYEHFVVVYKMNKHFCVIGDPALGLVVMSLEKFLEIWTGHIITAQPGAQFTPIDEEGGKFKKYLKIMFDQKRLLTASVVMSLMISVISIISSSVFYAVVEKISMTEQIGMNIDKIFLSIFLMYLSRTCISIMRGKVLAILSKRVECNILFQSYSKLLNLPLEFFESRTTGEIMSRFDDVTEICNAISNGALTLILDTLIAFLTGVLLFCLSPKLTYQALLIIALYVLIIIFSKKPMESFAEAVRGKYAHITSLIKQTVDGILVIKSNGDKNRKRDAVCKDYEEFVKLKADAMVLDTAQSSIAALVASVGLLWILWSGTKLCIIGKMSLSILLTYYNILDYFLSSITNLVSLQFDIQTAVTSAERLNDILDCKEVNKDYHEEKQEFQSGDIEFEQVSFRYGGGPKLFENLSFKVSKGKKVAVIGESGCGKSTVGKLVSAFYDVEDGSIMINKVPLSSYSEKTIRKNIMYVSANSILFNDSIKNNITLGRNISDDKIKEVTRALELNDLIESLPYGYETLCDENGSMFSTGQRQRINLARALVQMPEILVLDEATSNLDPVLECKINDIINSFRGKTTCIIIAHKMNTIKDCDQIILMDKGKFVKQGTHEELLCESTLYRKFINNES